MHVISIQSNGAGITLSGLFLAGDAGGYLATSGSGQISQI